MERTRVNLAVMWQKLDEAVFTALLDVMGIDGRLVDFCGNQEAAELSMAYGISGERWVLTFDRKEKMTADEGHLRSRK